MTIPPYDPTATNANMSVENSLVKSERLATYPDSKSMDEHGGSGLLVQAPKRRCSGSVLRLLGAFLCVVGAIVTCKLANAILYCTVHVIVINMMQSC